MSCKKHKAVWRLGCPECDAELLRRPAPPNGSEFSIGQAVTVKRPVGDDPSGDSPGGIYASPGEKLIIRRIGGGTFPISVSHEHRTDGATFGVKPEEINALPNTKE